MRNNPKYRAVRIACLVAALPLFLANFAAAQSGRRAPRTLPAPAITYKPAVEPEKKSPESTELPEKVSLLVARQPTNKRFASEDVIFAAFINRLNQYSSVAAKSLGDLKRDAAAKRAKSEAKSLVVLLQLEVDSFQEGTILLNSQDLIVRYAVFAPFTGKEQSKGKVYYQGISGARLRKSEWPTGTPIKITPEAAGVEAAEQLYAWLRLITTESANN